jgi:preprotein translocase subunit SecD
VLIGWTIDLAAIAGIIATIGTGIDSQIIILDETLTGESRNLSLREKIKKAFFIVFGAGGTIIAAMFPLMILGFGLLRGFAITTIIGVLAGILIARPAYGAIVEKLEKD